jgi:hypothetical protein
MAARAKKADLYLPGDEEGLHDACLEGRHDGATWDLFYRVLGAYVRRESFKASKRRVAVAWRRRPRTWWGRLGLVVQGARGAPGRYEHNYHCVVCGENILTAAGGRIYQPAQDRMMNHVGVCLADEFRSDA